jgi:hypothetical protein
MRKIEEKVLRKRAVEPAEPYVRPWQVSIDLMSLLAESYVWPWQASIDLMSLPAEPYVRPWQVSIDLM